MPDTSASMMNKKHFTDEIDVITNYYDGINTLDQASELLKKGESIEASKASELQTAIAYLRKTLVDAFNSHADGIAKSLQNIKDSIANG